MDPQVIEALQALEKDNRRLKPKDVIDAARNRRSPLHNHFTWDNTIAAERWRMQEAAMLIRRVKVLVTVGRVEVSVPKYLRDLSADNTVEPGEPRGYQEFHTVRSSQTNARIAVLEEMRRASQAVRRARMMAAAMAEAWDFDETLDTIDALANSIICRVAPTIDDQPQGSA